MQQLPINQLTPSMGAAFLLMNSSTSELVIPHCAVLYCVCVALCVCVCVATLFPYKFLLFLISISFLFFSILFSLSYHNCYIILLAVQHLLTIAIYLICRILPRLQLKRKNLQVLLPNQSLKHPQQKKKDNFFFLLLSSSVYLFVFLFAYLIYRRLACVLLHNASC